MTDALPLDCHSGIRGELVAANLLCRDFFSDWGPSSVLRPGRRSLICRSCSVVARFHTCLHRPFPALSFLSSAINMVSSASSVRAVFCECSNLIALRQLDGSANGGRHRQARPAPTLRSELFPTRNCQECCCLGRSNRPPVFFHLCCLFQIFWSFVCILRGQSFLH